MAKKLKKQAIALKENQNLRKASERAGITPAEMKKKLERFTALATGTDWKLAISMIEGSDEAWFFEGLLAGSRIKKGYLLPGKVLMKVGDAAEVLGLIALVNAPETAEFPGHLDKALVKYWDLSDEGLNTYANHVFPKAPWISSQEFSKYVFWELTLENLSNAEGEVLGRHKGHLILGDLESLSDEAAYSLSKHKGFLQFNELKSLSDAAAQALRNHKGGLWLDGLTSLSDAAAQALGNSKGDLTLNNLKSLSDAAAQALSKHKGFLQLNNLVSLSGSPGYVALAEKLANQKACLTLNYLTSLSDATAQALGNHKGELWLKGLTRLSEAAANGLSKHKGDLHLDSLKSLSDSQGHVALAEKLSKQERFLSLSGLTSLSDAAAKALANKKSDKLRLPEKIQKKVDKFKK